MVKTFACRRPTILVGWRGPSLIDGGPVRVVVYCLANGSKNRKTGRMAQVLICRDDVGPYASSRDGTDASVCGACPLRPASWGGCYVNLGAYFPRVWETSTCLEADLDGACEAIRDSGLALRIGSWGDPSAVPADVIRKLVDAARGPNGEARHTMYTCAWRHRPDLKDISMASVLSVSDKDEAERAGWRTLRVRRPEAPRLQGEVVCPGSKEAGHKSSCAECLLCSGAEGKGPNVVVGAHGSAGKVNSLRRRIGG